MRYKVFILSSVHRWNDTRIFYKQASSLAKKYDVEMAAIADFQYKDINGIKVHGLPKRKRYARFLNWWELLRLSIKAKADVYHFHDPELILLGLLLKLMGKRVIYDIHEDYPKAIMSKAWIPQSMRKIIASIFNGFEKKSAKRFDYNITVTEDIAEGFKGAKIDVVKNYPLYEQHDISRKDSKNEIWVVYVGVLAPIRGIQEMVQAMDYIDPKYNVRLKLAGNFSPPTIEKHIRDIAGHNVDILGFLDYGQVYELLEKCDIGLVCLRPVPNYITALPIKLFEYMSCGLPVIASNFPLWRSIIEGNKCGLTVDPLDVKAMAKAIEYLASNPDLRYEMGINGYEAYKSKYNWNIEERKLFDVYERLLNS